MNNNRIYWIIGQSGTGKTTLGKQLHKFLSTEKRNWRRDVFHIDEVQLRRLFDNADYSKKGNFINTRHAQAMAEYIHEIGCDVVISIISPDLKLREQFKDKFGEDTVEILLHTDEPRDSERVFNPEFEQPEINFIDINTTNLKPEKSFSKLINHLTKLDKL